VPSTLPEPQEKQAFFLACEGLEKIGWGKKDGWQILDIATFVNEYGAMNVLYAQWMAKGPNVKNPAAVVTSNIKYRGIKAPEGWLPPPLRGESQSIQTPVFTPDTPKIPVLDSPPIPDTLTTSNPQVEPREERRQNSPYQAETQSILDVVFQQVRPQSYNVWFRDLFIREMDENFIVWDVCSQTSADFIERKYGSVLQEITGKQGKFVS